MRPPFSGLDTRLEEVMPFTEGLRTLPHRCRPSCRLARPPARRHRQDGRARRDSRGLAARRGGLHRRKRQCQPPDAGGGLGSQRHRRPGLSSWASSRAGRSGVGDGHGLVRALAAHRRASRIWRRGQADRRSWSARQPSAARGAPDRRRNAASILDRDRIQRRARLAPVDVGSAQPGFDRPGAKRYIVGQ